jgi:hypothetical protein
MQDTKIALKNEKIYINFFYATYDFFSSYFNEIHDTVNQMIIHSIIISYVEILHVYFKNILICSVLHKKTLNIT